MQLKASAPGSLMLLGEYAVLHGKPAMVCAIDKRITITLSPRNDKRIEIHSESLGSYATDLTQLKIEKPFQFVLGAIQQFHAKLKRGCDIEVHSDFSDKVGFGSSAAVTVATLATLIAWLNIRLSPLDLVRQGRNVIKQVQGVGSGADIAAAVYGGIVAYQAQPLFAEKLAVIHPLAAVYSGYKTTTADAIKKVQNHFALYPNLFRTIVNCIGQCAVEGIQLVKKEDFTKLGDIFNIQQGMMESLGVSNPLLNAIVQDLRSQSQILGAKISGSGLGDCVIGLGEAAETYSYADSSTTRIPVAMTLQGVILIR